MSEQRILMGLLSGWTVHTVILTAASELLLDAERPYWAECPQRGEGGEHESLCSVHQLFRKGPTPVHKVRMVLQVSESCKEATTTCKLHTKHFQLQLSWSSCMAWPPYSTFTPAPCYLGMKEWNPQHTRKIQYWVPLVDHKAAKPQQAPWEPKGTSTDGKSFLPKATRHKCKCYWHRTDITSTNQHNTCTPICSKPFPNRNYYMLCSRDRSNKQFSPASFEDNRTRLASCINICFRGCFSP